jgi:hypothetical protein
MHALWRLQQVRGGTTSCHDGRFCEAGLAHGHSAPAVAAAARDAARPWRQAPPQPRAGRALTRRRAAAPGLPAAGCGSRPRVAAPAARARSRADSRADSCADSRADSRALARTAAHERLTPHRSTLAAGRSCRRTSSSAAPCACVVRAHSSSAVAARQSSRCTASSRALMRVPAPHSCGCLQSAPQQSRWRIRTQGG